MSDATSATPSGGATGSLMANVMHFARALRAAGLPIGPGRVCDAIRAVETVGIERRDDFYWALHSVFVNRRDQVELFDQAFHMFWRDPELLKKMMSLVLPGFRLPDMDPETPAPAARRTGEALNAERPGTTAAPEDTREREIEIDAAMTWSDREKLQHMDFEQMSAEEIRRAKAAIAAMRLPIMQLPTRRFAAHPNGRRIDMRATLRTALRSGGREIPLRRREPRRRHPPLVILCDISGSMSRYSRMLLHFLHTVTNDRDRVHSFLFGTRLTNVTRGLRHRDVDAALSAIGRTVHDWSGGTRIGKCLRQFNVHWSRRVLAQGAVVLLISDGLDRDAGEGLAVEMERLHKSCRRLIWLNPLLRYDGFEPKSMGVRAILPHVDMFRPVHNLASLEELTAALGTSGPRVEEGVTQWRKTLH